MKNILILAGIITSLGLSGCQNSSGTTAPTPGVAATPQACGTSIPGQYCTSYNPGAYSYNNLSYGSYGYGYYGSSGFAGYGCPVGYQSLYLGNYGGYGSSSYTCVVNNYFNGYTSGYTPYYAYSQSRFASRGGHGPAQACAVGAGGCAHGNCLAFSDSNMGYCAR